MSARYTFPGLNGLHRRTSGHRRRPPERSALYRFEATIYLFTFIVLSLGIVTGAALMRGFCSAEVAR